MFGKMLPKNLEAGMGMTFTFDQNSQSKTDTVQIYTGNGYISVKSENSSSSLFYAIHLSPYLVYHFPIKSNVDVFAGGFLALRIGNKSRYRYTTRQYADDYEYKSVTTVTDPFSFGVGAGALVGAEYFVHKNIAVGLSGNFGFSNSMQFGREIKRTEVTNSGVFNPIQGSSSSEVATQIKNIRNSLSLRGGVGFNLTFFFTRKEKGMKQSIL